MKTTPKNSSQNKHENIRPWQITRALFPFISSVFIDTASRALSPPTHRHPVVVRLRKFGFRHFSSHSHVPHHLKVVTIFTLLTLWVECCARSFHFLPHGRRHPAARPRAHLAHSDSLTLARHNATAVGCECRPSGHMKLGGWWMCENKNW